MPHALDAEIEQSQQLNNDHTSPNSERIEQIGRLSINRDHQDLHNANPQDVQATLHYLSSQTKYTKSNPPVQVVTRAATTRDARTTVRLSQGPLETIYDVRGREDDFTLERNGFRFLKHKSDVGEWECRDRIWTEYVERECRDVIVRAIGVDGGVDEVVAFHEGKRGSNKEWKQASDGQRTNPFARQVHVDQTERTIRNIVKQNMDIKAEWLLKGRVRQVNIWRPLHHPVYDCGLCVADAQTVRDDDMIECHRIRESDGGFLDTMGTVKYREGRKWYYKSMMEPDDCVLFVGYDSDCAKGKREGPGFTLHSAFDIPNPPPGSPPRHSIEVRLLVFTYPKEPLSIHPPLGMLTAQAPPRNEDVYASHHTSNAEIEGASPPPMAGRREHPLHMISIPDVDGEILEIDLNDYDQLSIPDRINWYSPFDNPTSSISSYDSAPSPSPSTSTSPNQSSSSWISNHVLSAYTTDLTEQQLQSIASQRVNAMKRQYEMALKVEEQLRKDATQRRLFLERLNSRRKEELRREREMMARRIRSSCCMEDL